MKPEVKGKNKNSIVRFLLMFLLIAALCFVLGLGLWVAEINYDVQIKAMNQFLKQEELNNENVAHTRLILRYIKQKELYNGSLTRDSLDHDEFIYNRDILPDYNEMKQITQLNTVEKGVVLLINLMRYVTGKNPILISGDNDQLILLYSGYYHERARNYEKAIGFYNQMLAAVLKREIKGNVLLHKGYCFAMLEEYEKARSIYQQVIKDYMGMGVSTASEILLHYMDEFKKESDSILQNKDGDIQKGEKLINLLNHKVALKVLKDVKGSNPAEKARLEYYKGICFEELGNKKEAINSYVRSIQSDITNSAALYANRRIYTIATDLPEGSKFISLSRTVGEKQNDPVLQNIDKEYQEMQKEEPVVLPEPIAEFKVETNELTVDIKSFDAQIQSMVETVSNIAPVITNEPVKPEVKEVKPLVVKPLPEDMVGLKVKITTISNEIFTGVLLKSQYESFIIDTLVGPVKIGKENVKTIKPLQSKGK